MDSIYLLSDQSLSKEVKRIKSNPVEVLSFTPDLFKEEYKFYSKDKTLLDNNPLFFYHNEFKFFFSKKAILIENKKGEQCYFDFKTIAYRKDEDSPFLISLGFISSFQSWSSTFKTTHTFSNRYGFSFESNIFGEHSQTDNVAIKIPLTDPLYYHPIKPSYSSAIDTEQKILSGNGCTISSFKKINDDYLIQMKYSHIDEVLYNSNFEVKNIKIKPPFYKKIKEFKGKKNYNSIQELNTLMFELKEIFPLLNDTELKTRFPDFNKIKQQVIEMSKIEFPVVDSSIIKPINRTINEPIDQSFNFNKIDSVNSNGVKDMDFLIGLTKYLWGYKEAHDNLISLDEYKNLKNILSNEFLKLNKKNTMAKNNNI